MFNRTDSGVLFGCDECIIDIRKKLKEKKCFEFKDELRTDALRCIISSLYTIECTDKPEGSRIQITDLLIEHGQFLKEEIDKIFEECCNETASEFTNEFYEKRPDIDFIEYIGKLHRNKLGPQEVLYEKKYYPTHYDCNDKKNFLHFCTQEIQKIPCPDCGIEILNNPTNVTMGYEKNLVCSSCVRERKDEFDIRGLVLPGNPDHHGEWRTQEPEFLFSGTDYFTITHPRCEKSPREDKKGIMLVNGVWFDDSNRVVLSLECIYCKARNALKPAIKKGEVQLLNQSGAEWKRIASPIDELIQKRESDKLEFKSSLRWSYNLNRTSSEIEIEVARSISSFLNSNGGTLILGIDDYGNILGLEKDFKILGKGHMNSDGFELCFTEIIHKYLGKQVRELLNIEFYKKNGDRDICVIEIEQSPKPVFLKLKGENQFVVRSGNRNQKMDARESHEYITQHWKD